jgi:hypothetical protein
MPLTLSSPPHSPPHVVPSASSLFSVLLPCLSLGHPIYVTQTACLGILSRTAFHRIARFPPTPSFSFHPVKLSPPLFATIVLAPGFLTNSTNQLLRHMQDPDND